MAFSILKAENFIEFDDIDNPLHTHISQSHLGSFSKANAYQYPVLTQLGSNFHWHVPSDSKTMYIMSQKVSHVQTQDSMLFAGLNDKDFYFTSLGEVNAVPLTE